MVDKITTVIGRPIKDIRLRLHLELVKKYSGKTEYFVNQFGYNDKEYLAFDLQSYITLEMTQGDWNKDKSIMITEKNLYEIRKGFRKMARNMYQKDIFVAKKSGEIILPKDMEEKYTEQIYNIGQTQKLLLKPTVVEDFDGVTYEGIAVFINNSANIVTLSITEFEALLDIIDTINIFMYSHQLLNIYLNYTEKMDALPKKPDSKPKHKDVFADAKEGVEYKTTKLDKEKFFGVNENTVGGDK